MASGKVVGTISHTNQSLTKTPDGMKGSQDVKKLIVIAMMLIACIFNCKAGAIDGIAESWKPTGIAPTFRAKYIMFDGKVITVTGLGVYCDKNIGKIISACPNDKGEVLITFECIGTTATVRSVRVSPKLDGAATAIRKTLIIGDPNSGAAKDTLVQFDLDDISFYRDGNSTAAATSEDIFDKSDAVYQIKEVTADSYILEPLPQQNPRRSISFIKTAFLQAPPTVPFRIQHHGNKLVPVALKDSYRNSP